MVYEVDFVNDHQKTIFTALIYASTVTKCREEAKKLSEEKLSTQSYHIYIGECEI